MALSPQSPRVFSPWRAGLRAARLNLIPGLVLQFAAIGLLIAYYSSADLRSALSVIEIWKAKGGYAFAAIGGALFCGLLPWLFRMCLPSLRPRQPLAELIFGMLWWAMILVMNDAFYRVQALVWGTGTGLLVVLAKVIIDMFVYTPLLPSPMNALSHHWKEKGFPWGSFHLPQGWYRRIVLPNLIPNWVVWIPGTAVVYSLPPMLQLPMANLIGCFWSLLCISIAASGEGEEAVEAL